LNSSGKYVLAAAVAVILVVGALTLPFAFDDHMADAKKYKKHHSSKKKTKKAEIEAEGGNGGTSGLGSSADGWQRRNRRCKW
jgi:hypothetical protein